jgi:peptidyl-prolyl cis-trans isomerase D
LGNPASLEAAATANGQNIQKADSLLFSSPFIPNAGQEAKVIGSAFNKQLVGKPVSSPIPGNGGVFVIKVENVSAKSNPNADLEQQRFTLEQQQKSLISYRLVEALKKSAVVKDERGKFF